MRTMIGVMLLAVGLAAQPVDQSIAVTVSRTVTLQPDSAALVGVEARVAANPAMTVAQVVRALESVGFREEHLIGVQVAGAASNNPQQFGGQRSDTSYSFQMTAPAESFRDLIAKFEALRRQLPQGVTQLENNVFLSASQRAVDEARQAALAEMYSELRSRAEALAQLAGGRLGSLLSLTDTGNFGGVGGIFGQANLPGMRVTFTLSARFARQ